MNFAAAEELAARLATSVHSRLSFPKPRDAVSYETAERGFIPPRPSVAFGISKSKNGWMVVARIQDRTIRKHYRRWHRGGGLAELIALRQRFGSEFDCRYIGKVSAYDTRNRVRPVQSGVSVGHHKKNSAGTLGAIVRFREDPARIGFISNAHVLTHDFVAGDHDHVVQPGILDRGVHPRDTVARLTRFVPIDFVGINHVDGAVAEFIKAADGFLVDLHNAGNLPDGKRIKGIRVVTADDLGLTVLKFGRSTGRTQGRIKSIVVDNISVDYSNGRSYMPARFNSVLDVLKDDGRSLFCEPGDSGSLVLDEDRRAVGVLFAGVDRDTYKATYVIPIEPFLEQLNVDLIF